MKTPTEKITELEKEILKEVLEEFKNSEIYHKDVQVVAEKAISLTRQAREKEMNDIINEEYRKYYAEEENIFEDIDSESLDLLVEKLKSKLQEKEKK